MPTDDPAMIEALSDHPSALPVAASWICETWGNKTLDQTIEHLENPRDCPPALIAVIGKVPVGVIGFSRWQRPDENVETLWIDALYVIEDQRSSGLGSRLLAMAVDTACSFADELYVYTDIPTWYEHRGWGTIETTDDGDGSVRNRTLTQSGLRRK